MSGEWGKESGDWRRGFEEQEGSRGQGGGETREGQGNGLFWTRDTYQNLLGTKYLCTKTNLPTTKNQTNKDKLKQNRTKANEYALEI